MTAVPLIPQAPEPLTNSAADDVVIGFKQWDLWGRLGWLEIKRRYRRTVIGPFWSVISLTVVVLVIGGLGAGLLNQPVAEYVPFLAAGMVVWMLLSVMITESCVLFVSGANLIRHIRLNYSILAYALVYRNFIVFLHHLVVYLGFLLAVAPHKFSFATLFAIPGLLLLLANGVWIALLLGMICLRFRDTQQLVNTLIQIALFVTPIFWPPDTLGGLQRVIYVDLNPLYHLISIVRMPLLGEMPGLNIIGTVLLITFVGYLGTFLFFRRFRQRIVYWS
jgi:ABC-type polysaccharide/polyol phosphate export permease